MRTQPPPFRQLALTLGFALTCVVLVIVVWFTVGGPVPLQSNGYRVSIPFGEAPNLPTGADVQIAGVRVGRVSGVRREGTGARVTLELSADYAPLRRGARAQLRSKTLLGEGFVELVDGPRSAPAIADGGRLAARDATDAVQLDQFLSGMTPAARRDFRGMMAGLAKTFGDHAEDVSDAAGEAASATTGMRQVLGVLDRQRADMQQLLANAGDVLGAVGRREGSVRASLTAGNRLLATTAARRRELERTVAALPAFLRQLRGTSRVLTEVAPDLRAATSALMPTAKDLRPALRSITHAAPSFERLFAQLTPTSKSATTGLPALTRIVRSTPPAFNKLYPAARELAPVTSLVAADRFDIIGIMANIGSVMNGVSYGPGNKLLPYGTGFPTVWNEAIGGYEKKLPTNRPNPYPKPGALKLAPTGHLNAFQCRHTGNPLLLPPTGSGTPPCTEQGPWTLLGKTAYYPALDPAPPANLSRGR